MNTICGEISKDQKKNFFLVRPLQDTSSRCHHYIALNRLTSKKRFQLTATVAVGDTFSAFGKLTTSGP
jgi:hypothetical protein